MWLEWVFLIPITSEELRAYFKSLLDGPDRNGNLNSTLRVERDEKLDQPIVDEEVTAAIQVLKRNKAPGEDGLPPERVLKANLSLSQLLSSRNFLSRRHTQMLGVLVSSNLYIRRERKRTQTITEELLYSQFWAKYSLQSWETDLYTGQKLIVN